MNPNDTYMLGGGLGEGILWLMLIGSVVLFIIANVKHKSDE